MRHRIKFMTTPVQARACPSCRGSRWACVPGFSIISIICQVHHEIQSLSPCAGASVVGLPSKRLGLFAAPGGSLIVRSDSNGEDLESFAGAGAHPFWILRTT